MNETFVKARTIFDRMMEESLARHTASKCLARLHRSGRSSDLSRIAVYDSRPPYTQPPFQTYGAPQDSRVRPGYAPSPVPQPQPYGWNPAGYERPGYNAYFASTPAPAPQAAASFSRRPEGASAAQAQQYAQRPQTMYAQTPSYGAPYGPQPEAQPQGYPGAQPGVQAQVQAQAQPRPQSQPQAQYQQSPPQALRQPQVQPQPQPQPQQQPQPQPQLQAQTQPQLQPQPQPAQQSPPARKAGPPYVYDPAASYPDQNVQAWAQYYAQGGKDPTGAVYFISVPGVKEGPAQPRIPRAGSQDAVQQQQQQVPGQVEAAQAYVQQLQQQQQQQQKQTPAHVETAQVYVQQQQQQQQQQPQQQTPGHIEAPQAYIQPQQAQEGSPYPVAATATRAPTQSNTDLHAQPVVSTVQQEQPGGELETGQHPQQQQQQQAGAIPPSSPTADIQQQPPTYGAPSYVQAAPAYGASPPADSPQGAVPDSYVNHVNVNSQQPQVGWQGQYHDLPNQFAGIEVSGATEGAQGPQGVGAPA
ncbi:uncharacterized protein LAESUDRAFT_113298 [Laetiporus sulphureus 93-53]|uniref:Uncharacterized protein n=1 Tax=Laetiporus sulphureus 93-53 TaxID=1314785 RepID=A0A165EPU1_9APHY|nr:uncharacterized protein LAESUDRAFT_113298 [Laetiporus sulphureus 93-53]KZT07512.1 hypothetical protein LAESUDRAFT_113298 [Laetiporus sulphureus 93-53]